MDRSRSRPARRAPSAVSSAMSRAWPGQRPPEGVRPDVVDEGPSSTGTGCAGAPQCPWAGPAGWRTTRRTPGGQRTSSKSQVPVGTRVPRLSSSYRRTCVRSSGGAGRLAAAPRSDNGASAGGELEASPGDRLPGRGRTKPQDPGTVHRLSRRRALRRQQMPGLRSCQVMRQRRSLQEKNRRQSEKAGCEVSPPGPKWRLLW